MKSKCLLLCCLGVFVTGLAPAQESKEIEPVSGKTPDGGVINESTCGVLAAKSGLPADVYAVGGLHALGVTADKPLRVIQSSEMKIKGVVCWRSEARLVATDYLVPRQTGLPLYIKTDTEDEARNRTIVLELAGGSYRVRQLSGPEWSAVEEEEMIKLMTSYNQRMPASQ